MFIVCGSPFDSEVFGNSNLYLLHVFPIPQVLHKCICESKDKQVLHRLLAQVMVNAVDP